MIRAAGPEDVPTIIELIRALADYERLLHQVVLKPEEFAQHLFGPNPAAEVVLAVDGSRVQGFALYFQNFSTFLGRPGIYLEDLFVRPEARGRGHGKALLSFLARVAVDRGCGRLEWSVLDWNEPAIRFYNSLGALPQSEWTVHRVTGDALTSLAESAA